jgi:protein-tyrosine-phosphatase/DNA-binding MarR family transcriptional regulator
MLYLFQVDLNQFILSYFFMEEAMTQASTSPTVPDFLKLLSHEIRWKLLSALAQSDYRVQELVRLVDQPANLVSYHLRQLRDQHVVIERRSSADERSVYYSLDLETVRTRYRAAGDALHPALGTIGELSSPESFPFSHPSPRVLFLCTENSARSQIAEALLRHLTQGRIEAYSAGSHPTSVHPLARQVLEAQGISTEGLRSKSLDEFASQTFDQIVTVCDRVREWCPPFPGTPACIHWSLSDPATVEGSLEERYRAFEQTSLQLATRLRFLLIFLQQADKR